MIPAAVGTYLTFTDARVPLSEQLGGEWMHPRQPQHAQSQIDLALPKVRSPLAKWMQSLLLAVLIQAVRDLDHPPNARVAGEVRVWLASESEEGPFAFRSICEALGFSPPAIRRQLRTMGRKAGNVRQRHKD